jgi:hypothetical protein
MKLPIIQLLTATFAALFLPLAALGQAVVTIPAINPNYNPNRGEKPIIPRLPQTSSKPPIDPNDYIGVDISKMSSSQRAKIESAFRKHTGEGFTGSKYDPNSPKFAFGPKAKEEPAKSGSFTAEQIKEIAVTISNYQSKQISQATALKFLEVNGVGRAEGLKLLELKPSSATAQ